MSYRGYIKIDEYDNNLIMEDIDGNKIIVFICDSDVNIQILKNYITILKESNVFHSIIIYKNKITPSSTKILQNIKRLYEIELFTFQEMSYDIQETKYFYPHIKLNNCEKKEIINKFGYKIPIILSTDPVIRYLNYKKGDIVKILRKDNYIHYRLIK